MCRVVCKDTSIISFEQFIQTENFYFLTKKINFGTQGNSVLKKSRNFAVANQNTSRSRAVVARQAHNLEVAGSIPASATKR